ncbi:thiol reductant ABC exporter subunit CydD [Rhodopila sp.]|jgi:ATP-binding cassette subfamily C protein CydD|uniref:thiol reductant ABC exporter subunit CydD n=1 Tax=Rhodopila sp. TaxID=2480087 RepID=UPI002C3829CB|nr:thiol reductant ABC exporter subunit CydD [Rhodopila sp.]HVZ09174.1 thiol reductant ABC exporter subunit CydD [Rhodopila sp.]
MANTDPGKAAAKTWLRQQQRAGSRAARPVLVLLILNTLAAVGQAIALALGLTDALTAGAVSFGPIAVFAGLALVRVCLVYATEQGAFAAGAAARRRLRTDALTRLLAAGPALLRRRHSGDLASIVVDRVEAMDGLFSRYVPAMTFALAGPVVVLLAVLWIDPWAAVVLAVCGVLVPVGMAVAGIGAAAASRSQFLAMARLQARFLDRVRGITTIVMAGRTEDEARDLALAATDLRKRTMRILRVAFLSSVVLDLAAAAALVILAIHYFVLLRPGQEPDLAAHVGPAMMVLLLTPEFFAPLRTFAAAYQDRLHATGAAESLVDLPPLPEPAPARETRTVAAQGVTIAFDNVTLTWDPARGPALDGLSFRVAAGETLVLAGPSGAGKSSVIEIVLGFVRPDSGRVTINGADITDLVPQALSRLTAWIGQRPVLFAGSIRDNIRFARPEASDEEVNAAAKAARVEQFAALLPSGLETRIGEGGYGLSGGQAQRIAIARAYLKNAPLLLLDEPTAHLDPATEQEVLDSLKRLAIGRTVILASHSSAAHAWGGRRLDLRHGQAVSVARGAA